jgi:hypothetical protein
VRRVVGRDLAPAEDLQALALDDLLDGVGCALRVGLALRQERDAGGVRAFRGQREVDHGAEELVRDLEEDAGAVTRVGFGARGTTVLEVHQRGDRLLDDVPAAAALHVHDERDTTGIVLVRRVIQPLGAWKLLHT